MKTSFLRKVVISIAILVVMVLFSACSGLGNGQQDTITHVPAYAITFLQSQGFVGKTYTVQVTTNSDGTFSIVGGSNFTLSNSQGTPTTNETPSSNETPTNETPTANEPGSM